MIWRVSNCDGKGHWMRVGYINVSEPCATCPPGLTLHQYDNINHGLCSRPVSSSGSSASIFFSTYGVIYNKVCGQVIGHQYGSPDGFPPDLGGYVLVNNPNIDNIYVNGVSITYDSNPRKHVWTLGVGVVADDANPRQDIILTQDMGYLSCRCFDPKVWVLSTHHFLLCMILLLFLSN